jgi:hypothetical protein
MGSIRLPPHGKGLPPESQDAGGHHSKYHIPGSGIQSSRKMHSIPPASTMIFVDNLLH